MQQDCSGNDHNDQLVFESRHTAWMVSALLLLLFFVFMVGYFLGKHQALEQFSHDLDQESIADKIYCSLYASYAGPTDDQALKRQESVLPNAPEQEQLTTAQTVDLAHDITTYYAPLIGFGSQKMAQKYADRLTGKGFPVMLKRRVSKTTKGREIQWYQVVTQAFKTRAELESLIAMLEKQEHLKNIEIITT